MSYQRNSRGSICPRNYQLTHAYAGRKLEGTSAKRLSKFGWPVWAGSIKRDRPTKKTLEKRKAKITLATKVSFLDE
jgi:hypothetical protein